MGGVRSPLAHDGDTVDLMALLKPDAAVLVADAGLGTINAVLLSFAALAPVPVYVILNRFDAGDSLHVANRRWLTDRFGLDVSVILRTRSELGATIKANSFAGRQSDPTKLHVTFLATAPGRERVAALEEKRFEPDEFFVKRDAVYLHCPHGYGQSKLSNAFFEQQLGVVGTTRNWRTVTVLAELAAA